MTGDYEVGRGGGGQSRTIVAAQHGEADPAPGRALEQLGRRLPDCSGERSEVQVGGGRVSAPRAHSPIGHRPTPSRKAHDDECGAGRSHARERNRQAAHKRPLEVQLAQLRLYSRSTAVQRL